MQVPNNKNRQHGKERKEIRKHFFFNKAQEEKLYTENIDIS